MGNFGRAEILTPLGCRGAALGFVTPPHPATITRVLALLGAQRLAEHTGSFTWRVVPCRVGGPPDRRAGAAAGDRGGREGDPGATGADGGVPYLLAAAPMGEYFQNGRTVPVTFTT